MRRERKREARRRGNEEWRRENGRRGKKSRGRGRGRGLDMQLKLHAMSLCNTSESLQVLSFFFSLFLLILAVLVISLITYFSTLFYSSASYILLLADKQI